MPQPYGGRGIIIIVIIVWKVNDACVCDAGKADDQLNAKKKIWEQIQPDLRIDANGIATYKGAVWKVEGKDGLFRAHSMTNSAVK